jgi:hypothetical protein
MYGVFSQRHAEDRITPAHLLEGLSGRIATLIEERVRLGGVAGLSVAKLSYLPVRFRQPPRRHRVGHQGGRLQQLERASNRRELVGAPCR